MRINTPYRTRDVVVPMTSDQVQPHERNTPVDALTEPLMHLPADTNSDLGALWRYMDWFKYEHLVHSGTLWLSTAAELDDGEGEFVQYAVANPAVYRSTRMIHRHALGHFLISCWHEAEHENAHMWDAYASSPDSVVIKTTAHRMGNCFTYPRYARLHRVQYTESPLAVVCEAGHTDVHSSVLYKHTRFAGDQEVRLICEPDLRITIKRQTQRSDGTVVEHESWDPDRHGKPRFLHVDPFVLVSEVRPHPHADYEDMKAKIMVLHAAALTDRASRPYVPIRPSEL